MLHISHGSASSVEERHFPANKTLKIVSKIGLLFLRSMKSRFATFAGSKNISLCLRHVNQIQAFGNRQRDKHHDVITLSQKQ